MSMKKSKPKCVCDLCRKSVPGTDICYAGGTRKCLIDGQYTKFEPKHYEDSGLTPERVAELAQAERDGRLVVLDKKPLPLVSKPDCTDAYCPYCDEDVSGLWGVADYVPDICQCPECGEFVDVYAPTITREEAEAALAKEGEK